MYHISLNSIHIGKLQLRNRKYDRLILLITNVWQLRILLRSSLILPSQELYHPSTPPLRACPGHCATFIVTVVHQQNYLLVNISCQIKCKQKHLIDHFHVSASKTLQVTETETKNIGLNVETDNMTKAECISFVMIYSLIKGFQWKSTISFSFIHDLIRKKRNSPTN